MKLLVKKTNKGLLPMFDNDFCIYSKIPLGEEFEIEYKKKRNLKFHKKFFALIKMTFENQELYNNIDHLRRDLTIEAGYYDLRANIHGEEIKEPKSISFASMDQTQFDEYYNACLDAIVKYFHFDKQDIIENIEQYF